MPLLITALLNTEMAVTEGDDALECRETLRFSMGLTEEDRLVMIGARESDRLIRDEDRRDAASNDGRDRCSSCCQSGLSGITTSRGRRERERDGDLTFLFRARVWNSSSESAGVTSSPSAPQPIPQATSSTIAIVHRVAVDRSRQPCSTRSAPRPMPGGTSYAPNSKSYELMSVIRLILQ